MGRPKLPSKERKTEIVKGRVIPSDKEFLKLNFISETELINAAIAKQKELKKWSQSQKPNE